MAASASSRRLAQLAITIRDQIVCNGARETQPDSPGLLIDLGSAISSEPKPLVRPLTTAMPLKSFGKALSKSPDDPVALFNRATSMRAGISCTPRRSDDWEHYLRVDPRGGWADEAHKNLDTIGKS